MMSSTQLDYLELTAYSANPETPASTQRMLASVGTSLKYWNGTAWVTLEEGTQGDFTAVVVTPTAATTAIDVVGTALTTGKGIDMSDLNALTTGIGLHIASSATAIATTGRLVYVNHTGATGTSAVLNEFASAATDETVVFRISASAALAGGVLLDLSGAAVTTGNLLDIGDADALTTGTAVNVVSNSASTGTRSLMRVVNDNALATGTTPLYLQQDAPTATNFKLLMTLGTISIYTSNETSPNTALTATKGSICLNGSATGQAFWNTDGATAWTALA